MVPTQEKQAPLVVAEPVTLAATDSNEDAEVFEYTPPQVFGPDSSVPTWLQAYIQDVYIFITTHYNFWMLPFLVAFYWMYHAGYGLVVVATVVLYAPSLFDGSEKTAKGRPWDAMRTSKMWLLNANYVGIKIFREQALDASKRYIFGFHPHGIIILSRIATYGGTWEAVFPKIVTRALGASSIFAVPLARELCLWLGVVDASRSTADKVLKNNYSICVYPGGVPEIFLVDPKSKDNTIVLKNRLGFVKLAIRHGAELVPTFVFGEKWFFNVWNPPKSVISFFRKVLKIPVIVFWGRFMWVPKRLPEGKTFGVVYGKPIPTVQKDEPTEEDIRTVHTLYVAEIERLFEQYKAKFGYDADEKLVIT
uniref:Acyltransferase n=1 Tax=Globisporangium ultimum (strain ATCC 200006 / CBS 805.95 / DAOM BR144) TaxID=431595 RepID=K3X4P9_GLOUD